VTGLATETGNKAHALDVRRNDLYETPREAVLSLLAVERLPHLIWEPACGPGTTRNDILDMGPLARVHVFSKRLPMMHRDGWTGPKASASMDFAWFIWQRGHNGPPELRRVNWRDHT